MELIDRPTAIWSRFHVGMRCTVRESEEAYYSGYGGRPSCAFEPGMIGVIASVDNPYVRRIRGRSGSFACVDFLHPHLAQSGTDFEWRAGVDPKNLVALDPPPKSRHPGILYLIDTAADGSLSPYTAMDSCLLRSSGVGAGGGIYGPQGLQRLLGELAEHGYTAEVIAGQHPVPRLAGAAPSTPSDGRALAGQ